MTMYQQLSTDGIQRYVILCQMISVYKIFLKSVQELPMFQLSNGYKIQFCIELILLTIILRKSKLLLLIAVFFVTICLKLYNMFFATCKKIVLLWNALSVFINEKCYKTGRTDFLTLLFL